MTDSFAAPTRAVIEASIDKNGKGATRKLLTSWGVEWPLKRGWKKALLRAADDISGVKSPPARNIKFSVIDLDDRF